ncbi:DUF4252 domain-containing protein [Flavobacterium sp. 14A]|uniref:DUF4252 domain-containing protein n=1 Tax=Flavobacterium sp. 14A TaxID=2735896 RepID=UPI00156E80D9|nr:DUF4252 domain-containing protein [Flavobacterium sp. 14A]NRT11146.1 hypothetical protein [Flavobacterium sp. 14A]
MKKYIVLFTVLLYSGSFFAQANFDKYNDQDDIKTVVVNKKMFDLMSKVKVDASDVETQKYMALIKKLDNLKVYTTTSNKRTQDMKATADKYVSSAGLEELMLVNQNGKNVKISVKSGAGTSINELLMFIDGTDSSEETVLMSLTGNFNLNELSVLTDKIKIPGGLDLKNVSKAK